MAKKRSYAYGTCPTCKGIGYHRQKKSGVIYLEGNTKAKCSRFKCKYCGSWFGFFDQKDWENANEEEVESETDDWEKVFNYSKSINICADKLIAHERNAIDSIRQIAASHVRESNS